MLTKHCHAGGWYGPHVPFHCTNHAYCKDSGFGARAQAEYRNVHVSSGVVVI